MAALSVLGQAVKAKYALSVGVKVLAAANIEAVIVAHATGLDFICAESYIFAPIADEGLIEASAACRPN